MAQTIQVKRSTATAAPATLANGELAYSHVGTDGKLFIGRPGGTTGDIDAIGGKYYVDRSETAYGWGDHSTEGYLVATSAGYNNTQWDTAYNWGDHSVQDYAVTTGDTMTGNLVFNDNVKAIFGTGSDGLEIYHDGTNSVIKDSGTGILRYTSLVDELSGVTFEIENTSTVSGAGSFVSFIDNTGFVPAAKIGVHGQNFYIIGSTGSPIIEAHSVTGVKLYDKDGDERLNTTLLGVSVSGSIVVSGTVDGRDVAVDGTKLDTIETSANNYTLANLNAHLAGGVGSIVTSGYIRGPAAMVIDPAAHGDETGALTILGDLIVEGTTTTINSTVVEIADERVVVNREQTGIPTVALVAGLEVERGTSTNAYLLWREANSGWYVSDGGAADFELLHANNWSTAYTGVVDGGSF